MAFTLFLSIELFPLAKYWSRFLIPAQTPIETKFSLPPNLRNSLHRSPGFFAPEMITEKEYSGYLCDTWSVGCVFLELLLGRETFTEMWMPTYGFEILSDTSAFLEALHGCVESIGSSSVLSHVSREATSLLQDLLCVDSRERNTLAAGEKHPWLNFRSSPPPQDPGHAEKKLLARPRSAESPKSLRFRRNKNLSINTEMKNASGAASPKTMKLRIGQLRLPPIDPETPKIRSARKIVDRGDALLRSVYKKDVSSPRK